MGERLDRMMEDLAVGSERAIIALVLLAVVGVVMSGISALARVALFLKSGVWLHALCDGIMYFGRSRKFCSVYTDWIGLNSLADTLMQKVDLSLTLLAVSGSSLAIAIILIPFYLMVNH
ncbi:hypothetical protein [Rhizobium leguminosarum]|uniref:hypothetical protein n=1 Tax=Rhizobium leguminosarum TaxID=384 RepID=UPI0013BD375D|nr:hypothetical protein [Rhizobium leguminosarum]NEI61396.1 hypothetical protein [Rhizobium leguminosarum]